MKRNCDDCIFAQRSGGCVSWNCEPIPIREAEKAWKEKNAPIPLTIEERIERDFENLKTATAPEAKRAWNEMIEKEMKQDESNRTT